MEKKINKVLEIWHKHFSNEDRHYSEFEPSDVEYFVGCMLYNEFAFTEVLDNLKTMDLSYDFLSACCDEYDEIKEMIHEVNSNDDIKNLEFLQDYIKSSKIKYKKTELYLLDRLDYHIKSLAQRYENPLLKK